MVDALCPAAANCLDVDEYAREIDSPLDELYQDLVHRLFEAPGSNPDDEDRGVGIESLLSKGFDTSRGSPAQVISSLITADFKKDTRVKQVQALVTMNGTMSEVANVDIAIVADAGELGITLKPNGAGGVTATRSS